MLQGSNDCAHDYAGIKGSCINSMLQGFKDLAHNDCARLEGSPGVATAAVGGLAGDVVVRCDVVVVGSTHM